MTSEGDEQTAWQDEITRSRIDYDTDLPKHYVRMKGWLPATRERARRARSAPLRYFTFCAAQAVDIFMLESEGILRRDQAGRLAEIYFCESDAPSFEAITDSVQSREPGFRGKFEEIVLFHETDKTLGRTYEEPGPERISPELRRQLWLKDLHNRLIDAFPFDVINLDAAGPLLPPPRDQSRSSSMRLLAFWSGSEIDVARTGSRSEPSNSS